MVLDLLPLYERDVVMLIFITYKKILVSCRILVLFVIILLCWQGILAFVWMQDSSFWCILMFGYSPKKMEKVSEGGFYPFTTRIVYFPQI